MDLKSTLSLKFTPAEIRNRLFKKTALGYSAKEVQDFLDLLAKGWERMQQNEYELTDKVQKLTDEVTKWRLKEAELDRLREQAVVDAQATRDTAKQEAEKILSEVEVRASDIRHKTEEWLEEVIAEVEETQRQKMSFMTAFKSALDSHYALLNRQPEDSESIGARLNNFLRGERPADNETSKHLS